MILPTLRLIRLEVGLLGVAGLVVMAIALAFAFALGQAVERNLACLATSGANCANDEVAGLLNVIAPIQLGAVAFAVVTGATLGATLVGTEIERGSAPFAWSLAASRRHWLVERALLLGATVGVIVAPAVIAVLVLAGALPGGNGTLRFNLLLGGPLLIGQSLVAFAIAGTVGTVTGRGLPSVVLATAVAGLALAAAAGLLDRARDSVLVEVGGQPNSVVVGQRLLDGNGRPAPLEEAAREAERQHVPIDTLYRVVEVGLPESDIPALSGLELGTFAAGAAIILAPAIYLVRWRLPRA